MKIIIEGCDGTGKTTLAKKLAEKYGLDICHCTGSDPRDYDFYRQTSRKENVIWDRHTIGELIYPEVFNRKQEISSEDARLVLMHGKEEGLKVLILTADDDVIRSRIAARGFEFPKIMDNIEKINAKFKFYADAFDLPLIDTSKTSFEEICDIVEH
jgi:broad-specificity NMP kinase